MKRRAIPYWLQVVQLLLLGAGPLWVAQACFPDINSYTQIKITVQDSTGKPLAGFPLRIEGSTSGSSYYGLGGKPANTIETYELTTDQTGSVEQNLHWHDKIAYYSIWFNYGKSPSRYTNFASFYPCTFPLDADCQLAYSPIAAKTTTAIMVQAKFR